METKETVRTASFHEAGLSGRGLRATMVALAVMAAGLFWVAPVAAQATGTITGTVADAETGAPVSGAQISVPAHGVGVLSSGSGRFVLPGIPVGTHELRADRLGFATVSMDVTVAADSASVVDLRMATTVLGLAELVVTGTAFSESLVQLP